tara:strand:- start:342 stop:971 length:630 start_codon:yes stop_codon:yes gene_type:complete
LSSFAAEPITESDDGVATIIVEAHKNIEIFVAKPIIKNTDPSIEADIGEKSFIQYASAHWKNAKIKNKRGIYEPITMHVERVYFYDKDTIEYVWPDCNYKRDPLKCGAQNEHYTLIPHIEVDSNQLVIRLFLYDNEMQIINSSTETDDKIINWIRQQELTVIQQQGMMGSSTIINKPKEEHPLKWEIPHNLVNRQIHQASLKLWSGLKF